MGLMDRFPWSKGEIVLATSKEWGRQGFFFKLAKVVYLLIYKEEAKLLARRTTD